MADTKDIAMAQQTKQDKPDRYLVALPKHTVGADEELVLEFSGDTLFPAREAVQILASEQVLALLDFIEEAQRQIAELKETMHPDLNMRRAYIAAVMTLAEKWAPSNISEETPEERALVITYRLLRDTRISHTEAANIASSLLKKTYSADAWRKKVERWVEKKGIRKIEKRRTDRQ